jgi:hypothetical protein
MGGSERKLFRLSVACQRQNIPDDIGRELTFFVTFRPHIRKATANRGFFVRGGSGEIRTRDQRIKSPLLYRLSYRPVEKAET